MMEEEKAAVAEDSSLISELTRGSVYNTPVKSPGEKPTWITPEFVDTKKGCVDGMVYETHSDLSRPEVIKLLALSTAAADAFEEDILCPVQLVPRILCIGMACVDVVLTVDDYPQEDSKVRSTESIVSGGGNAANTAVALSRLGFPVCLVSKRGTDLFGQQMVRDLHKDGVDTTFVSASSDTPTAVSHVIVNSAEGTRTCIHSPLRIELTPAETAAHMKKIASFEQYGWIHFDSRHTAASVEIAKAAKEAGCFISIDAEKDRPPYFRLLLSLCDVVFISKNFAETIFPNCHGKLYQMMLVVLEELCPNARLIVCTDGANGSFLLKRPNDTLGDIRSRNVHNIVSETTIGKYVYKSLASRDLGDENKLLKLPLKVQKTLITREGKADIELIRCTAMCLRNGVVDSTGAGDAYIGGFLAGLLNNYQIQTCMALATLVATKKLGSPGARIGLISAPEVRAVLNKL